MADVILTAARPGGPLRRAMLPLGLTQLAGWGTTYYLPAVLKDRFSQDLGVPETAVFGGVAVAVVVAGLLAWPAGRLMDRHGAGRLMPAGSVFLASGLLLLGASEGWITFFLAWVLFGFGMALAMGNAAFSAVAQMAGQGARRAITFLMLFGGMAATVFWPLTLWLDAAIGWRGACFAYAALHFFVCAPLHLFVVAKGTEPGQRRALDLAEEPSLLPPEKRRLAAGLIVVALAANGFVSWGLELHLISLFREFGLAPAVAVWAAAARGPATMLARSADFLLASRITPMTSALTAGVLVPLGLAGALVIGQGLAAALLFIMLFSFGTGLMAVARATLPLMLLGSVGYATTIGRLTLPTQLIYAASPMTFSIVFERMGAPGALWIALAASTMSLAALACLARLAAQARA